MNSFSQKNYKFNINCNSYIISKKLRRFNIKQNIVILLLLITFIISGCSAPNNSNNSSTSNDSQISNSNSEAAQTPDPFDANINNNSLAISPDENIAVVANSSNPNIIIYDLNTKKIIRELEDFVTPRNIAFSKNGKGCI